MKVYDVKLDVLNNNKIMINLIMIKLNLFDVHARIL